MKLAWNIVLTHTVSLITHDYLCFVNVEEAQENLLMKH